MLFNICLKLNYHISGFLCYQICKILNIFRQVFPFGRPESGLKTTLSLLERVRDISGKFTNWLGLLTKLRGYEDCWDCIKIFVELFPNLFRVWIGWFFWWRGDVNIHEYRACGWFFHSGLICTRDFYIVLFFSLHQPKSIAPKFSNLNSFLCW